MELREAVVSGETSATGQALASLWLLVLLLVSRLDQLSAWQLG